jgi:PAS domain S-box-containing protein
MRAPFSKWIWAALGSLFTALLSGLVLHAGIPIVAEYFCAEEVTPLSYKNQTAITLLISLLIGGLAFMLILACQKSRRNHAKAKDTLLETMHQSNDALLVFDSERRLVNYNDAAMNLLGANLPEMKGKTYSPFAGRTGGTSCILTESIANNQGFSDENLFVWNEMGQSKEITATLRKIRAGEDHRWVVQAAALNESSGRDESIARQASSLLRDLSALDFGDINTAPPVFDRILSSLLEHTDSEYGFIGRVLREEDGTPFLSTVAITDISWDKATSELYQPVGMIFKNLDTLFGAVLKSEEVLMSNSPADHANAGGLPKGHPPLDCFIGIPLKVGGKMIGMVGLANRQEGYHQHLYNHVVPLIEICSQLIQLMTLGIDHKEMARKYQRVYDEGPAMYIITQSSDDGPIIIDCNRRLTQATGYKRSELIGQLLSMLYDTASRIKLESEYTQALNDGLYGATRVLVCKDGTLLYTRLDAVPYALDGKIGTHHTFLDVTAERLSEMQSRDSIRNLGQLFNSAEIGYLIYDPSTDEITGSNETLLNLLGFRIENVQHRFIKLPQMKKIESEVLKSDAFVSRMISFQDQIGDEREILITMTTGDLAESRQRLLLVVAQHVSNERRASIQAQRLAMEIAEFVDTASAPIIGIDSQGIVNVWNGEASRITGFSYQETMGKDFVETLVSDSSREKVAKSVRDLFLNRVSTSFEFSIRTLHGSDVELVFNLSPRKNIEGDMVGALGVGQDISQAKKARAEVERTAAELRQFVDTANAPIFGTDADGLVNEWNQMTEYISGVRFNNIAGHPLTDVIVMEDREAVSKAVASAVKGIEASNLEFNLQQRDGKRATLNVNMTTRRDVNGEILGILAVGQDVTELRVRQAISSRTQRLQALGQLTGGIAHDFNNLLTIIKGNLEYLEDNFPVTSDEIEAVIADAKSAALDGANLTRQLLAYARRQPLNPQDVNVGELLAKSLRMIKRTLGENTIIEYDPPDQRYLAVVDPAQLEIALLNLCINARDAMKGVGTIIVRIDWHEEQNDGNLNIDPGRYVHIAVSDHGHGIPEDELDKVFDPFFTTKEIGKGSGLGLSMVQGFITQSKGAIQIESKLGKGTTIDFYLPCAGKTEYLQSFEESSAYRSTGTTVLIVEDEDRVRRFASRSLKSAGFRILEAVDVEHAKSIILTHPEIDIVFSDIVMPGQEDGRDLEAYLREEYPDVRVVMTSGFENPGQTNNESTDDVLRKPYSIEDLLAALTEKE